MSVLARHGAMLHKDLACVIGVSASGLTAIIKQMNATSVQTIHVESVGKFKIYSITPVAYKYTMHNILDLLPEMNVKIGEERLDFSYAVEVRKKIQGRKIEAMENEDGDRIEYLRIRDKNNKKYSEKQLRINRKTEFGRMLA